MLQANVSDHKLLTLEAKPQISKQRKNYTSEQNLVQQFLFKTVIRRNNGLVDLKKYLRSLILTSANATYLFVLKIM